MSRVPFRPPVLPRKVTPVDEHFGRLGEHLVAAARALEQARTAVRRADRGAVRQAVDDLYRAAAAARARVRFLVAEETDSRGANRD